MLETNQRISRIIPIEKNDFSTKINGFVIDKSIDVKTNVVEYLPRVYETDFANKGFANVVFVSEEYTKISDIIKGTQVIKRSIMELASNKKYY